MAGLLADRKVRDALRSIIDGKTVKRAKHNLTHEGENLSSLFIDELAARGYRATTVEQVGVQPGERVPAFLIEEGFAHFGWVFWEQFTSWKLRKLWGSVQRNTKGDWDIQIPATRPTTIYANDSLKIEMDIDHPADL